MTGFWAGKNVLVTGAGGFIGSHLTEALAGMSANVRAFVHYNGAGTRGWLDHGAGLDQVEVVAGDVTDGTFVRETIHGIDIVFHLAALIGIPYSYRAVHSYLRTNVEGTVNVLEAARAEGVSRVVHTSTSEVYGSALAVPIKEDHPLQGQSPYSASKIAADKFAESFHLSFGLPVITVRPFNTYGPRQSARAVIPTLIAQALSGGPLRIGNLQPTRDFNFVQDTVTGFIKAAEASLEGAAVNLGSGVETSIGELAAIVADITGANLEISKEESRVRPEGSEVMRLCADNSLALQQIGWHPSVGLREGLAKTADWIGENLTHYRPANYSI